VDVNAEKNPSPTGERTGALSEPSRTQGGLPVRHFYLTWLASPFQPKREGGAKEKNGKKRKGQNEILLPSERGGLRDLRLGYQSDGLHEDSPGYE
jgi:hypothetical protein